MQWEDDVDLLESPNELCGEVRNLDFHAPTNVFSLATPTTTLLFSAGRLTVELRPLPPAPE